MASTSEFRMLTDINSVTPKSLEFNYDEIKEWLVTALENYKGLIVTSEYLPEAKKERATLNKVQKAIQDQRLAVKKEYMKPYDTFKAQCDELEGMIKEVSQGIDKQIKDFEEIKKEEKFGQLSAYFENIANEKGVYDFVDFEDIANEKWGNATCSIKTAEEEIDDIISKIKVEVDAIKALNSPYSVALLDFYKNCHSLAETIKKNVEMQEMEKTIFEKKKEEEPAEKITSENENILEIIDFRVWVNNEQKLKLKDFLIKNEIKYGKVI